MEFINRLVAFGALMSTYGGLMAKSRDQVEESWIQVMNAPTETALEAFLGEDGRELYRSWIDQFKEPVPVTREEPPPGPEPEPRENVGSCVNCGAILGIDPLTGTYEDRCPACGKSSSIKEEEEPARELEPVTDQVEGGPEEGSPLQETTSSSSPGRSGKGKEKKGPGKRK